MKFEVFVQGSEPNTYNVFQYRNESIAKEVHRAAKLFGYTAFVIVTPL